MYIINDLCYYRNVMLKFSTPYLRARMPQDCNYKNININIGLNTLKFHKSMEEFCPYLNLNEYSKFLEFMLNFENTIYEKIVKNNDLTKLNFIPLVKSNKILFYDEEIGEYNEKKIMGYTYSIKLLLTPDTKFYKYNWLNNTHYKIKYINVVKNIRRTKFILFPLIKVNNNLKQICVHLVVCLVYQYA